MEFWNLFTSTETFLVNTQEFKGWGWENDEQRSLTISFLGICFFTALGAYGQYKQNKKIWTEKSGELVSVTWNNVFTFAFASFFVYGIETYNLACVIHGSRILLYIPILIGLYKFDCFTKKQLVLSGLMFTIVIIMVFLPKDVMTIVFIGFILAGIVAAIDQPLKIYMKKKRGKGSLELIGTYTFSTTFWVVYTML
ncbi:MAG: hypothetical protein UZ19_OD1000560 [Parcubacteria bacterium OLB19]|nr:MAG: hypothetical protein UZ19_OD1000560 [Parcubacteria bacterium OLB19]